MHRSPSAQAAPGPNVLFVAVMGYQAAGLLGAAATLTGIMLPSTVLALIASRWGHARAEWRAVRAFKTGMAPITHRPAVRDRVDPERRVAECRERCDVGAARRFSCGDEDPPAVADRIGGVIGALGWV